MNIYRVVVILDKYHLVWVLLVGVAIASSIPDAGVSSSVGIGGGIVTPIAAHVHPHAHVHLQGSGKIYNILMVDK